MARQSARFPCRGAARESARDSQAADWVDRLELLEVGAGGRDVAGLLAGVDQPLDGAGAATARRARLLELLGEGRLGRVRAVKVVVQPAKRTSGSVRTRSVGGARRGRGSTHPRRYDQAEALFGTSLSCDLVYLQTEGGWRVRGATRCSRGRCACACGDSLDLALERRGPGRADPAKAKEPPVSPGRVVADVALVLVALGRVLLPEVLLVLARDGLRLAADGALDPEQRVGPPDLALPVGVRQERRKVRQDKLPVRPCVVVLGVGQERARDEVELGVDRRGRDGRRQVREEQ